MRLRPMGRCACVVVLFGLGVVLGGLGGCGGGLSFDLAYTGGGLPPGEPDIGGIVVAAADDVDTAQDQSTGEVPVVGAEVRLIRGRAVVGLAIAGDEGFFRFEHPDSGRYTIVVRPPEGSGLGRERRQVQHVRGRKTFVEMRLERVGRGRSPAQVH